MSHVDDAHWSVNFEQNGEGWYVPECQCGWKWAPVPDAEDAADALMQHAYEQGVLWQRSLAARSPRLARLAGTAESAWRLVSAYTAWENDHNDGEFALWREPDVVNAIIELRAALSSEDATRPTPEPQSSEGGGNRGHLSSAKAAAAPDPEKRDATRPTGRDDVDV